ncbi:MSMEG_0570 family protein [Serratia ficaria]|uniref:MSMEG_0570 family nitrogen starvation response protein n=1 Tax=Enterobacterales TaxID=91347 RepID=UPI000F7DCA63|nr:MULTISPECIES: MSMEG_0570 family nitrogen starvation response protein [Enterobacterales]RSV87622.1 MSMEG_0570 family nitrogen starvation response protein [Klebsiella aerogenes]CAI1808726.1 MSMEG_0570 family protein [Serratia ficaria]
MPAMHFVVRWPDGSEEICYSPSTAIEAYLTVHHPYTVAEFTALALKALNEASERVASKFGYACSSAMDQASMIEQKALRFSPSDSIIVEKITVI